MAFITQPTGVLGLLRLMGTIDPTHRPLDEFKHAVVHQLDPFSAHHLCVERLLRDKPLLVENIFLGCT